jgi:ribonucleoside-diphosphate reductase beta chain
VPSRALLDPQALYELWEREQWSAHAIDLRADREQWRELPLALRERLDWHIAAFFVGEERVSAELSPLVRAHETSAEAAFLATQQVDEARHAQYFDRFYADIAGTGGGYESRLRAARSRTGAGLAELLDDQLADAGERLWRDRRDPLAKVDFVVLYHMIIEGVLALTGQRTLLDFLDRRDLLPGWREGLRLVERDEHRHVAYGAWLLHEKSADPALREHIGARVRELLPPALAVLVPPGARPEHFRPLGRSGLEVQALARTTVRRRMRAVGIPV